MDRWFKNIDPEKLQRELEEKENMGACSRLNKPNTAESRPGLGAQLLEECNEVK